MVTIRPWEKILTSRLRFKINAMSSLDGLDVSIDGVDIPLFFNSLDILADSWACYSYENKRRLSIKRPLLNALY